MKSLLYRLNFKWLFDIFINEVLMSKPSNKTWIRLALYICLSLTVFACGGGGGGGGGGENTDTEQPALGS